MFIQPPNDSPEWQGLPVQRPLHELIPHYLQRTHALLMDCLKSHPRWSVFRIDLRVPDGESLPLRAMTDFIESMKSQLMHAQAVKRAAGKRGYDPMLRYLWVREWQDADFPHYHVALLLNRDAYFSLGDYSQLQSDVCSYETMLAGRICKAWGAALGMDWRVAGRGVYFPERPVSPLLLRHANYLQQFAGVFYRLSYFAKLDTKPDGDGQRNFGMSQLHRHSTGTPWATT
ncbi:MULTISPECIES: inovirus Gp2 family protein [unclassified Pseudomonas]|uniref:inovirus Gp2 family protein n=1 Tax=unclassified Pseudomonas TaxID=196821 RepID=UPI001CF08E0F|nr:MULTISPECIES: inovirus Gp2 family protein [unclassified Pseudomonas]MDU4251181.1 inovirus Gp2 family protein [Pseudomonas sp.]UCL88075.1 inovirus Gp2 family protein [Pseudomonas sp. HS-18]